MIMHSGLHLVATLAPNDLHVFLHGELREHEPRSEGLADFVVSSENVFHLLNGCLMFIVAEGKCNCIKATVQSERAAVPYLGMPSVVTSTLKQQLIVNIRRSHELTMPYIFSVTLSICGALRISNVGKPSVIAFFSSCGSFLNLC